jgi:AraC-like DNA-binding protein
MNTLILPVRHPLLRHYVQSFLFFNKKTDQGFTYTTFPNTNVCLAIYRNSSITYKLEKSANHCRVSEGGNRVTSRLYGFHKLPFTVFIKGAIDQVCILFKPGALRNFTRESFADLWQSDQVVEDIFDHLASQLIDSLFTTDDLATRADVLEQFLLAQILPVELNPLLKTALELIEQNKATTLAVNHLSTSLHVSEATLYRVFMEHIGQSPKAYCQTIRFRQALSNLVARPKDKLTQLAYLHDYYDQAHYTKDIKQFTGHTPKQLMQKSSHEQNELIWIPSQVRPA